MQRPEKDPQLTIAQARERLAAIGIQVTAQTVRNWVDQGVLQGTVVKRPSGRRLLRVFSSSIDQLVAGPTT